MTILELIEVVAKQVCKFDIRKMCELFGVPRSSYYFSTKKRTDGKIKTENKMIREQIIKIYYEQDGVYGAPKIRTEILKLNLGFAVSVRRVGKIMKSLGLRSVVVKKYRPYKHDSVYMGGENLLNREFEADRLNKKWVSDITYIYTVRDNWVYLASIMDLATKKIIGWSISKNINTDLVLKALDNALIHVGKGFEGVILHSDRGCQYTSHAYQNRLKKLKIRQSFSEKGCPYDNAPIESWHSLLKKEFVYRQTFNDFEQAKNSVFYWIESRYNRNRIHSAIGYLTPQEAEDALKASA